MIERYFTSEDLAFEAADLSQQMSLRRAATMLGVSSGQVARWRDGACLTEPMARRVAVSIVARDMEMVGIFGRVNTRGLHIAALSDSHGVIVRVHNPNDRSER